jgi:hypothetical protein
MAKSPLPSHAHINDAATLKNPPADTGHPRSQPTARTRPPALAISDG